MIRNFSMTAPEWNSFPKDALNNKFTFERELYNLLFSEGSEEGKVNTVLKLPCNVSIQERHKLHKFNKKYKFGCESSGYGENRMMKIFISKSYLLEIFNTYFTEFEPDTPIIIDLSDEEPEVLEVPGLSELELFKKKIRDSLMEIITNLL